MELWTHWPLLVLILATVLELIGLCSKTKGDTITEDFRAWLKGKDRMPHEVYLAKGPDQNYFWSRERTEGPAKTKKVVGEPIRVGGVRLNTWRFYWAAVLMVWAVLHLLFGWWSA